MIPFSYHFSGKAGALMASIALAASICTTLSTPSFARPIPTNLPENQLNGADALYIIQRDHNKVWKQSLLVADKDLEEITVRALFLPARDLLRKPLYGGPTNRKQIAITIDDGPHGAISLQELAILQQYHVPATFFVVGSQALKFPEVILAEEAAGMTIGNHTFHHVSLVKIPDEYALAEIKTCGQVIENITGKAPSLFRPPGGEFSPEIERIATYLGYRTVLWTDDPGDYSRPPSGVIYQRLISKLRPGGIVLLHDGIPEMVEMLPQFLEYLRTSGYEVITLQQMLKEDAVPSGHLAVMPVERHRSVHAAV